MDQLRFKGDKPDRAAVTKLPASASALLILILFAIHVWIYCRFFIDDAFITFRYVQQWTAGNGLVYNVGDPVEGYSNLLWIVLLAPFHLAGFDLVAASKVLGVVLGLLTLVTTWYFGRRYRYPWLAPLLLAASGPFAIWMMGGLETPLFTFLLLLSTVTFLREESSGSGWFSGLFYGLLALTRPEGLMFAAIAILFRAWQLRRAATRPGRHDWTRLAVLILIVGAQFLWRYSYYGYLLPNTVYAKSMGLHPRGFIEGAFYVYQSFVAVGGFFFLALPLTFAVIHRGRDQAIIFLIANVTAALAFTFVSGGDWMPLQRFTVHILPMVFLLVQAGLSRITDRYPKIPFKHVVLILAVGQSAFLLFLSMDQHLVQGEGRNTHHVDVAQDAVTYLVERVQPGDVIAVTRAGVFSYHLPLDVTVVDMIGLTDAHIAHQRPSFPNGLLGTGDVFGKWDVDYVLAQEPVVVEALGPRLSETGRWSSAFTGTDLLLNDERFQALYQKTAYGFFERASE